MDALLGLRDSYILDGRVIAQVLEPGAVAATLSANPGVASSLGDAYKAINAPFGPFAASVLNASTRALSASDDATYTAVEASLAALTARRDALVASIRAALDGATFGNLPIDGAQAQTWIAAAQAVLQDAATLASTGPPAAP